MEKRKIDMGKYADMFIEKAVKGIDGTEIAVRNHISYENKELLARELLENTMVIHDNSCVYMSGEMDKAKYSLIMKYYTDVDTDGVDAVDILNFLINNDMIEQIRKVVEEDFDFVMELYYKMFDAIVAIYEDDNSLTKAIRTSFGFLFNGEDITESLAKAEAAKDTLNDAMNALREKEKQRQEGIDKGTMKIGGAIINFAKKE